MEHKSFSLGEFKALGDDSEPGSFEAIVAVFGNVDDGGDRIHPGAFTKSLSEWKVLGRSIPVLWEHDTANPPIGVVTEATERREGLHVKARLFIDENPQAKAIHAAMRGGALQEFSFGYNARDYVHTVEGGRRVRNLKGVHLGEVSPVFAGMNSGTRLTGVKSDLESQRDRLELKIAELEVQRDALTEAVENLADVADGDFRKQPLHEETPPTEGAEHEDKPDPKAEAEEDQARIGRLLAERPIHIQETDS